MKRVWYQNNNDYYPSEDSSKHDLLPNGIYTVVNSPIKGLYLSRTQDDFKFNYKIYNKDEKFIKTVLKSYDNLNQNLGILLTGLKGTGKSVTSKMICNELNIPVICITQNHEDLNTLLSSIQQPVVIFIDEYEKIYDDGHELLTLMDGLLKNDYKNVFLLTTNELYINNNLLQRPGRIRYVKEYGNLESHQCIEIINDLLQYPEFKDDCIEEISKLPNITIDLVKEIINEVNIHNVSPKEFMNIFNVTDPYSRYTIFNYDLYEVNDNKKTLIKSNIPIYLSIFNNLQINNSITDINDTFYGVIIKEYPEKNRFEIKYYQDQHNEIYRNKIQMEGVTLVEATKIIELQKTKYTNKMFNVL